MNNLFSKLIMILLFCLLTFSASNAQSFEGYVQYKLSSEGESHIMDYYVKGESIRFEMSAEGQKMASIITKEKMILLMLSQKMYLEIPIKSLEQHAKQFQSEDEDDFEFDKSKFIKNGKEKVLGYECNKYSYKHDEGTMQMWLAEGMGEFKFFQSPMQQGQNWLSSISEAGMFPLKMIATNSDGIIEFIMEALKLEKKILDAKLFTTPVEFNKMGMGSMFGN